MAPTPFVRLLAALAFGVAGSAMAQSCQHPASSPGAFQVTLPLQGTITVGADVPNGKDLYTGRHTTAANPLVVCTGPGIVPIIADYIGSPGTPAGSRVYETSIPGIGIAFWYAGNNLPHQTGNITVVDGQRNYAFNKQIDFSLYKIGPISPGVLQGSTLPRARSYTGGAGSINLWEAQIVGQLRIVAGTCRVTDVSVPLGTHAQREFNGSGQVSGWRDFDVELTGCPGFFGNQAAYVKDDGGVREVPNRRVGNRIGVRLDPSTPILDAARSIMAVQGTPGNRAAQGIGIQVAGPADSSFGFGAFRDSGLTLTTTENGRYTIPLRARYMQMEDHVRPGPANGAMVVTLRYE